jgi:hypothetical protein
MLVVASNSLDDINRSEKMNGVRVYFILHDVYSNLPYSQCILCMMCMLVYTHTYESNLDQIERNGRYLTSALATNEF